MHFSFPDFFCSATLQIWNSSKLIWRHESFQLPTQKSEELKASLLA